MPDEPDVPPAAPETPPATAPVEEPTPPPEDWAVKYRYLLADFENYRRRTEREREGVTRQARAGLIRELLPILEAFRAAREALGTLPPGDPVRHGLDLLDREWATFLKHEGVVPIAEVGQPFHPAEQEAVGETVPREGVPDGAVAEVVQQGYRFYGGILRPAKVVVARTRAADAVEASPSPTEAS
ncbi:MAG TPA: nucleotide exchange factor GrpE [Thermoplasmata archaeon]|nr:nucleotide exchange factor GrpE [Thermoplasmata archaeon]